MGTTREAGVTKRRVEQEIEQVDPHSQRHAQQGQNLAAPPHRDESHQQQAQQRDDHDDVDGVEQIEGSKPERNERIVIGDGQDDQGGCCKQQAQQEQPEHLDDHPPRQDALHRPGCGQQEIQVGVQQQGVEAEDETAENQDRGVGEERQAQEVQVVEPYRYPVGRLDGEPGDEGLPGPGEHNDGRSDDGARDAAGLTAADGLVEEHLQLGPPEQQADLESLHHRS